MNKIFAIVFTLLIFSCDKKVSIKIDLQDISEQEAIEDFSFKVKFDNILSLSKGNNVIYSGLTIGEVKEVGKIGGASSAEITPIVTLSIKKEYEDILYKDVIFTIKSALFVGDYWVDVSRGIPRSQKKILNGEILTGVGIIDKTNDGSGKGNYNKYEGK